MCVLHDASMAPPGPHKAETAAHSPAAASMQGRAARWTRRRPPAVLLFLYS